MLRGLGYSEGATRNGINVNDAPALRHADVGIAVKGATYAANATAAIILTESRLSRIIIGIIVAQEMIRVSANYVFFRFCVSHLRFLTVLSITDVRFQQHFNC